MDDREKIRGKKALALLKQTKEEGTVITMYLLGKGYDCLTIITGIRMEDERAYLGVDLPSGFGKVAGSPDEWRMRFDFTDRDRLSYIFRTSGGQIHGNEIYVPLPEFVERIQRRKSFRQEVPVGSRLHIESVLMQAFTLHDISEGGALVSSKKKDKGPPGLQVGKQLANVKMVFPLNEDEEELTVEIEKAVVRRVRKDPITGSLKYGLQFTKTEKDQNKALVEIIHRFERELLRKRQIVAE